MLSSGVVLVLLSGRVEARAPYDTGYYPCHICTRGRLISARGGLPYVNFFGSWGSCFVCVVGFRGWGFGFGVWGARDGRVVLLAEVGTRGLTAACSQCLVSHFLLRLGRDLSQGERQKRPQPKPRQRPNISKHPLRRPASKFLCHICCLSLNCLYIFSFVRNSSSSYISIYFWCRAKLAFAFFLYVHAFFFSFLFLWGLRSGFRI